MKSKVPNIKDINKILKVDYICGYNDKRKGGRRIKLINKPLSFKQQNKLQEKFSEMYPEFIVAVGNHITRPSYALGFDRICTTIYFKERKYFI